MAFMFYAFILVLFFITKVSFANVKIELNNLKKEVRDLKESRGFSDNVKKSNVEKQQPNHEEEEWDWEYEEDIDLNQEITIETKKAVVEEFKVAAANVKKVEKVEKKPLKTAPKENLFNKLEKIFAKDLMGVLGTASVVVGVVFLLVYTALSMGPLTRFLVVCLVSLGLYGLYEFLIRRKIWEEIALWIRSSSGVIFLVGTIASSQYPLMKWVDGFYQSWALILVGVLVNMIFGFLSKKQMFAFVHVFLSLVALLFMPFTYVSFVIASIVTIVGSLVVFSNKKWDLYILLTNVTFLLINSIWVLNNQYGWPESSIPSILLCLTIGLPAIVARYREEHREYTQIGAITHLTVWIALGTNLYLHSMGSILSTIGMTIGMILTFFSSVYAYRTNREWLFNIDRLVSLALGSLAILSLISKADLEYYQAAFCLSIFSLLYLKANILMPNKLVIKLNLIITHVSFWSFVALLMFIRSDFELTIFDYIRIFFKESNISNLGTYGFVYLFASFVAYALLFPSIEKHINADGFVGGRKTSALANNYAIHLFLIALFSIHSSDYQWVCFSLLAIMGTYIILFNSFFKNIETYQASIFSIMLTSAYLFLVAIFVKNTNVINVVIISLPLIFGALLLYYDHFAHISRKEQKYGISLIWGSLLVASYVLVKDAFVLQISRPLVGILWLCIFFLISLIKELKFFTEDEKENSKLWLTRLAKITLFTYIFRFVFVDFGNDYMWFEYVSSRVILEGFSLFAILFWMVYGTSSKCEKLKKSINNMVEIFLLLSVFYIYVETSYIYHGLILSVASILLVIVGLRFKEYNRVIMYSYIFFIYSLVHSCFIISVDHRYRYDIFIEPKVLYSILSISFGIIYGIIFYGKTKDILSLEAKNDRALSSSIRNNLVEHKQSMIVYPLIVSIAIFLFNSFDTTILSIFWILECFILFLLSLVLRNEDFRKISMSFIAIVCLRMIFYDLRGQDFLLKAIVFIVVGAILILMNAIYNKYKHRYEKA